MIVYSKHIDRHEFDPVTQMFKGYILRGDRSISTITAKSLDELKAKFRIYAKEEYDESITFDYTMSQDYVEKEKKNAL